MLLWNSYLRGMGVPMKRWFIAALLLIGTTAWGVTCPPSYSPLGDIHYVSSGMGQGSDIPFNLCYQYPLSGDYSKASISFQTVNASSTLCEGGEGASAFEPFMYAYDATAVTQHYCTINVPNGTSPVIAVAACQGSTCSRYNLNSGGGGWSSAPFGSSYSYWNLTATGTLPQPSSGTLTNYIYAAYAPVVYTGHAWMADIGNMWQGGTAASNSEYVVTVDGSPCTATKTGCTVNNINVLINCNTLGGSLQPNATTHDIWTVGLEGSNFHCNGWRSLLSTDVVVFTPATGVSGAHTITVQLTNLDASNNPINSTTAITMSFTVEAPPSLTYSAPATYPTIPAVSTWVANMAGTTATSGYPYYANQGTAAEAATPGEYFNDSSSSTVWTDWGAPFFYNVGRFEQLFGDILANCHSGTALIPCTNWSAGSKTQGQIIDNSSCFLVVVSSGGTDSVAPSCPAFGSLTTSGTVTYKSIGPQSEWPQLAQNYGDQYRANNLLSCCYLLQQEWAIFAEPLEERYFRRTTGGSTDTLDANAVQYLAYPFITGNGASYPSIMTQHGYVPTATERSAPYSLIALDMFARITGTMPMSGSVNLIHRWEDFMLNWVYQLTTCTTTGNIGAGWPNCANNIEITAPPFDAGIVEEALKETCQVEYDIESACDPIVPSAALTLEDWMYSNHLLPAETATGVHGQSYYGFSAPITGGQLEAQTELNMFPAPEFSWLGSYCGNCSLPTSGTPVWTVADDLWSHTWDAPTLYGIALGPKQYGQILAKSPNYLYYRTSPASGGWTGLQSEASASFNPYESGYPNLLGPFPQMSEPSGYPKLTNTGGAFTAQWYSAPASTVCARYAVSPADPWSATQVCGGSQSSCNTNANLCLNTINVTSLSAATYNVALGGTDSVGNVAQSEINWGNGHCCLSVTVTGGPPPANPQNTIQGTTLQGVTIP
jgi:hypothetical protein